ncbi:hypothetical protein Adt_06652 [Abeliophyllum distichum]|uniref:Uncharacterized protein n=1 Tax=Abeliophyllum distichum TaxID=126358 RepID=A0ABD1V808_9LAMI
MDNRRRSELGRRRVWVEGFIIYGINRVHSERIWGWRLCGEEDGKQQTLFPNLPLRLSVFTGAEEAQTCHWANAHCVRGEMNPRFFDTEDGAIPRIERYRGMKSRREMREIEERDVDINVSDPQIQKWIIAGDRSLGGEEFGFRDLGQKSRPQ